MANDINLTCRLNKASLPVMNTQQLVYVLIEAAPGAGMAQVQMPLNLSLVLDKSGSMQGKKIQNLRQAAKLVVDRLGPQDTISIVAFSDRKYLIAESQPVTDKGALKKKIDRIRDGGGTAISGGMGQGLKELGKTLSPDRVSRMLLLTDGAGNVSLTDTPPQEEAHHVAFDVLRDGHLHLRGLGRARRNGGERSRTRRRTRPDCFPATWSSESTVRSSRSSTRSAIRCCCRRRTSRSSRPRPTCATASGRADPCGSTIQQPPGIGVLVIAERIVEE